MTLPLQHIELDELRGPTVAGWFVFAAVGALFDPVMAVIATVLGSIGWQKESMVGVAISQVGIAAMTIEPTIGSIVLLEMGPVVLVVSALLAPGLSRQGVGVGLIAVTMIGMAMLGGYLHSGVVGGAIGLAGVLGLVSYGLHRYELVTLNLVPEEHNG